jgi:hypothetical protein
MVYKRLNTQGRYRYELRFEELGAWRVRLPSRTEREEAQELNALYLPIFRAAKRAGQPVGDFVRWLAEPEQQSNMRGAAAKLRRKVAGESLEGTPLEMFLQNIENNH